MANAWQDKAEETHAEPKRFASMCGQGTAWLPTLRLTPNLETETAPVERAPVSQVGEKGEGQAGEKHRDAKAEEEEAKVREVADESGKAKQTSNETQAEAKADQTTSNETEAEGKAKETEVKAGETEVTGNEKIDHAEKSQERTDKTDVGQAAQKEKNQENEDKVADEGSVKEEEDVAAGSKESDHDDKTKVASKRKGKSAKTKSKKTAGDRKKKKADKLEEVKEESAEAILAAIQRPGFLDEVKPISPKDQVKGAKKKKGKKNEEAEYEEDKEVDGEEDGTEETEKKIKKARGRPRKDTHVEKVNKKAKTLTEVEKEPEVEKKARGKKKDNGSKTAAEKKKEMKKPKGSGKEKATPKRKAAKESCKTAKKAKQAEGQQAHVEQEEPEEREGAEPAVGRPRSRDVAAAEEKKKKLSRKSSAYHVALRRAKLAGKSEKECKEEAKKVGPVEWEKGLGVWTTFKSAVHHFYPDLLYPYIYIYIIYIHTHYIYIYICTYINDIPQPCHSCIHCCQAYASTNWSKGLDPIGPSCGVFSGSGVWKDMTISISPRGMPRLNLHWHLGFMARGNLAFSAGTQYGVTIDHSSTKSKVWKSAYWCFKWGINIKTWNIQSYRVHPHARSSHGVEISSHDDGRCLLPPWLWEGVGHPVFWVRTYIHIVH